MDQSAVIRIAPLSDLHLEFEARRQNKGPDLTALKDEVDLILLAGDIDMSDRAIDFGTRLKSQVGGEVIQIAGNHEFYHANRLRALNEMRRAADVSPVHFLENDVAHFEIRGRMVRVT